MTTRKCLQLFFCLAFLLAAFPVFTDSQVASEAELAREPAVCLAPQESGDLPQTLLAEGSEEIVYLAGDCTASATCCDGSTVSCSAWGPRVTCSAADAACPQQAGYVRCGSTTKNCPSCSTCDSCSDLDYPGCSYSWDPNAGCCVVTPDPGVTCLEAC